MYDLFLWNTELDVSTWPNHESGYGNGNCAEVKVVAISFGGYVKYLA